MRDGQGTRQLGFPNLFSIAGAGGPSVLLNMPTAIEQHVDWISDCIEHMRREGKTRIEAKPDAQSDWVSHVNDVADQTLYKKARSRYVGASTPGKPEVFVPYVADSSSTATSATLSQRTVTWASS